VSRRANAWWAITPIAIAVAAWFPSTWRRSAAAVWCSRRP